MIRIAWLEMKMSAQMMRSDTIAPGFVQSTEVLSA
jgi:hypothetical protein